MALELGLPGVITNPTYPRLPKTFVKRYLDPNNIPSKHQTSEGIWKPRVIGAPQSPFITGSGAHLVDVMVSLFFAGEW